MGNRLLVCRAHQRLCGLKVASVVETLPALPVEPVAGGPDYVSGLSIIRGEPTPVVDVARLFGEEQEIRRYVTLRLPGSRLVALAFSAVDGLRSAPTVSMELPPLLRQAQAPAVAGLIRLDPELAFLLDETLLQVPEL